MERRKLALSVMFIAAGVGKERGFSRRKLMDGLNVFALLIGQPWFHPIVFD
jgi:hypothetical protein